MMEETHVHDQTIKFLNRVSNLSLEQLSSIMKNALALNEIGQYEEALSWYDMEISKNPADPIPWYNKGNVLDRLGKYAEAIYCYDVVLEIIPDDTSALCNKAKVLSKLGRFEVAISLFDKIISIDPTHIDSLHNKRIALDKLGMHYGVVPMKTKQIL
jgi:tetratricopeptide (TPR) repeat protein